jgi:hypothetical protein
MSEERRRVDTGVLLALLAWSIAAALFLFLPHLSLDIGIVYGGF